MRGQHDAKDPAQAAVEQTVRRFERATKDSDAEAFRALTTPDFYERYLRLANPARTGTLQAGEQTLGQHVTRRIESVQIDGDVATVLATVPGADAANVDAVEVKLVRHDDGWLVDDAGMRTAEPAKDARLLELTMADFSFTPNVPSIEAGRPLVIRAQNRGAQAHMVGIWLVPEDHELIKLIEATDNMPPEVKRLVNSQTFAAGDQGDIRLDEGLKPGRYMLTCFLHDVTSPKLTPHYDLGMLSEFHVR